MLILLSFICSFNTEYQNFINSPTSDSIFVSLVRDRARIVEYKDNPVVLWFWRSKTNDSNIDTLFKYIPISRNFYLSAVLRWEALEANSFRDRISKLKLAIHFDSLSIENFLSVISLGLTGRDISLIKTAFVLPIFSDFRNQIFLLGNFCLLLLIALFSTGIVYILTKLLYYLPALSHRLDPMKHNQFKGLLGFALLLIPVLVLRNFFLAFFIYGIILVMVFNRGEKNWLRLNIILTLLLSIIIVRYNFLPFLSGNSRSYQLYQMVYMDSDVRIMPETKEEKKIIAYVLKKQGFYDEAMAVYEDLYYNQGISSVEVINNLANLYMLYDEDDRAEGLYLKLRNDKRGEPMFNMALLKFKKIEYLAAGEYMEDARKKGYVSGSKEPVDIAPGNEDLYRVIMSEKIAANQLSRNIFLLLLIVFFVVTFIPFRIQAPFYCAICDKPVCLKCAEQMAEGMCCQDCLSKLKATQSAEIESELKNSLGRQWKRAKKILAVILNIIVPGSGLVYKNRNFAGFTIIFFVCIAYAPLLLKSYFVKPAGWISLPLFPIILCIGVFILFFCYLVSFLLMGGSDAD